MKQIHSTWVRCLVVGMLLTFVGLVALGCNTVRGVGKDVERAGQGIQKTAD